MPIKLFVSHISEESDVAELVKQMMESDFFGHVELFASSDFNAISAGADWLKSVEQALGEAAAAIVLCSRDSVQKPWVQFELGAAWMKGVPIIPVCHSGMTVEGLQMPLSRFQAIELSKINDLKRLYQTVAKLAGLKKTPEFKDAPDLLRRVAGIEEVRKHTGVQQFERYLDIIVPPPGKLTGKPIPATTQVESNDISMALFGFSSAIGRTWKDIEKAAHRIRDRRWIDELQHCIVAASNDEAFRAVQAVYHSEHASYQPQLAKKETLPDGSSRFHVHFVETVVAPLMEVQSELGLLATLLRLGLRFRSEVIDRFSKVVQENARLQDREAAERNIRHSVRGAIEVIENDALSRGAENISPQAVEALFETDEDRTETADLTNGWNEARAQLFKDDPAPPLADMESVIEHMRDVNFRFMSVATRRFHEVVCARLAPKSRSVTSGIEAPPPVERRRRIQPKPPATAH